MHLSCCGYRLGCFGLQASSKRKWNREIFPILFEKVTFNGSSGGSREVFGKMAKLLVEVLVFEGAPYIHLLQRLFHF